MIAAATAACIEITIVVKSLFVMQTNIKKLKCQISAWFGTKSLFKSYYLVFVVCIYENRPKVSTITKWDVAAHHIYLYMPDGFMFSNNFVASSNRDNNIK